MTTPAVVTIGKKDYPLAPLVFEQMERAWPFLQTHMDDKQPKPEALAAMGVAELAAQEMQAAKDAIEIIAIALSGLALPVGDELYVSPIHEDAPLIEVQKRDKAIARKIRKTMIAGEIPLLRTSILNLLTDSGLTQLGKMGLELDEVLDQLQREMSLTETSQLLSGSLSPQVVKAEAGAV